MRPWLDELDRLARGEQTGPLSTVTRAWQAEINALRQAQTQQGWAFMEVYPNLGRLAQGRPAGAGWSVELNLLVARFGAQVPLSQQALVMLEALARRHHGPVRSSDQ